MAEKTKEVVDLTTENQLKTLFEDGKAPSGDDFKNLIEFIDGKQYNYEENSIFDLGGAGNNKCNFRELLKDSILIFKFDKDSITNIWVAVSIFSRDSPYIINGNSFYEGNLFRTNVNIADHIEVKKHNKHTEIQIKIKKNIKCIAFNFCLIGNDDD